MYHVPFIGRAHHTSSLVSPGFIEIFNIFVEDLKIDYKV